ncbi:hypothetical protein BLL42_14525 [Pseudomonas frederiksbergensis]|uniref:DOMON domain-containing protein n=1 Tax=Pseudomonas frederiksbergensis TaxID=104087 RepID=A0A1J0ELG8_9PSED|nr:hypothetical protein [Pseudomonas frederiksbergensis]APC16886.1 hypothetical protein BLL42_14525 [Pseudomonas frederiksbergensis]
MKKLFLLMVFMCPSIAHSEVESQIYCFHSREGKSIKFEFRTYYDPAANWVGAGVKYGVSKESISLVRKDIQAQDMAEGGPSEFTTTWVEVAEGTVSGEYVMATQGALVNAMSYTNYKSKKHYSFDYYPNVESSPETGCRW